MMSPARPPAPGLHPREEYPTRHTLHDLTASSPPAVRKHWQAHTPPDFSDAPLSAVRALLACDALSIPEDAVLDAVLRYVARHRDIPDQRVDAHTSADDVLLRELLGHGVRLLSVSPRRFATDIEPLDLLDDAVLLSKYRFDALRKQLGARAALHMSSLAETTWDDHRTGAIPGNDTGAATAHIIAERRLRGMLRGRAVVAESEHPYAPGEAELLERVCVGECADAMLLEFDRRTHVAPGAQLTLYEDAGATRVVAQWAELWARPDRPGYSRLLVVEQGCVYVGLRVAFDAAAAWGWKLLALPVSRVG